MLKGFWMYFIFLFISHEIILLINKKTKKTMEQTNNGGETAKRPVFLTVLCILSFIAAGLAIIGYITVIGLMGAATAVLSTAEGASSEMGEAMSSVVSSGPSAGMTWAYLIVGFITVIVSLFGVIKMWKLQKIGFMLYVGATVVSMIMGIIYSGFGIMGVIFPILFIVLYGLNLKHLK